MKIVSALAAVSLCLFASACRMPGNAQDSTPPNRLPSASIEPLAPVSEGQTVQLRGAGSDSDGQITGYEWRQVSGPPVALDGADRAQAQFVAPQVNQAETLSFTLIVTDDDGGRSAPAQVGVVVLDVPGSNRVPVANAGADRSVAAGSVVDLSGSATDEDGSIAGYRWTQVSGSTVELQNADQPHARFTAPTPATAQALGFRLTATDDRGDSGSDEVTITVNPATAPGNVPPQADAGPDQSVDEGSNVQLSGTGTDSDGSIAGYHWEQVAGPAVALSDANARNPQFSAPQVDEDTILEFRLSVTDDKAASASDSVQVTVKDVEVAATLAPDALLDALLRGCDVLDTANCLLPFPSNHFTVTAPAASPQATSAGGTGLRINIGALATPRNIAGKPIDPSEWNRNDGFSPGALIATYVPGLSLEKTYNLPAGQIGLANLALSLDATAPVLLLEVPQAPETTPRRALAWAELDANASLLVPTAFPLVGDIPGDDLQRQGEAKAALLIRPAKNLTEGRRYIVVLRKLRDANGERIAAQGGFAGCRDKTALLPPLTTRCEALERDVFPVLEAAGIKRDHNLYMAWDFTVASTQNQIGRMRHMRDDAFATLSPNPALDDCTQYRDGTPCGTPQFTVDRVTQNPQGGIARRIEGTVTVPSYMLAPDASPLESSSITAALARLCDSLPAQAPQQMRDGCNSFREGSDIARSLSLPPNHLFYAPGLNAADAQGSAYGDGLPDRTGSMTTRYICQIPAQATPDDPARAGVYGHGLLDSRSAVTYDGVPDLSREFNYMFCAVDFFGFSTGDLGNVALALLDLSNFRAIPDASQQGFLNFMFLARLLRDPRGFAANAAFQSAGRPLFDPRNVFYDGNSQGGILGGAIIATSRDIHRGVLGSLGMNYSTLLTRSTDFDQYAAPLYLSYTDPLDRQLLFSMIQMLWDRSENNGYAAHLIDNSAFGGDSKAVKLDPQFGDHQVTMYSAANMARTMGIAQDSSHTTRVSAAQSSQDREARLASVAPVRYGLQTLNYNDAAQAAGSALVLWDDARSLLPPYNNTPPRSGRDPHDDSAKKVSGRCQKAHFLRSGGRLVDVRAVEFDGAACPAIPKEDSDGDGVPDASDRCPATAAGAAVNEYGCSEAQAAADDDGDGIPNAYDLCPATATGATADENGCAASQRDSDGDGVSDANDLCPASVAGSTVDATGCPVGDSASCEAGRHLAAGRSYQVLIGSESGEQISFQVLEPTIAINCAQAAQGKYPLLLDGHGFGGSRRTSGFVDNYRERGYTVISIDQRGHGDSTGTIRVMDPDYEGKDLIRVLDWAEQNLDYLAWRDEGSALRPYVARPANGVSVAGGVNLVVGSYGGSYGGGYQLLLHNVDTKERLDALAPDITWHDLRWSLNPGDVIKTGWDLLLSAGGSAGSYPAVINNGESPTQRGLDPYLLETLARGGTTGEMPRQALDWLNYHSPSYWCGLNNQPVMPYPYAQNAPLDPNLMLTGLVDEAPGGNRRTGQRGVPTLLSQGMRDTLFNFNDGWWNFQCMSMRGDDVRLITHQSGHLLPQLQAPAGKDACGSRSLYSARLQWFKEKLEGQSLPTGVLTGTEDAVCLSLSDDDAVDIPVEKFLAPHAPQFNRALTASYTSVPGLELAGVPQSAAALANYVSPLPLPQVLPLLTVREGAKLILAGIPQARIALRSPQRVNDLLCESLQLPTLRTGCDATVFVGLGLQKAGTEGFTLIDDQVLPVRGIGTHEVSLVGIGERLAAGDQLALLVYGYHPQYLATIARDPTLPFVNLEADLQLPLYAALSNGKPDHATAPSGLVQIDSGSLAPAPDHGGGVLGVTGSFTASMQDVVAALLRGDVQQAVQTLVRVVGALVSNAVDVLLGDSTGPFSVIERLARNIAAGNPAAALGQAGADAGALIGLDTDPLSAAARAVSAERNAEAVVLTGAQIAAWSVPAAYGVPYPYPSGAAISGDGLPDFLQKNDGHDAHNGQMLYPLPGAPMGKPVERIAAYRWNGTAFVEIPVQVDQKFPFFLANSASGFSTYSGTDEELTYEWDTERWQNTDRPGNACYAGYSKGMADPVTGLDADDEIAFMARDAGAQAPLGARPADADLDPVETLQEVALNDALNPTYRGYVYLGLKRAGKQSAFAGREVYVRYARDANADQWIDRTFFADADPEKLGTSNTGYGPNRSGKVCGDGTLATQRNSTDRFPRDGVVVTTANYRWQATGRWMVRDLRVRAPADTLGDLSGNSEYWNSRPDLIDRWKGRAFQQSPDSNISLVGFEDEQVNWEANATLLGERVGPVRAIREVWGADSGTNVTKTETFYRDAISYRYHLRVHPIPPDGLYTSWDYNRGAMVSDSSSVPNGRYYTALRPQGVAIDGVNDDIGQVDGILPIPGLGCVNLDQENPFIPPAPDGRCPMFFDAADASFNVPLAFDNWEQVSAKGNLGSLVYTFELTGATSLTNPAVVPYYRDDACLDDGTGDDPVPRPWPGESYVWNNNAVPNAYNARAGRTLDYSGQVKADCAQRQGAYGAHGLHFFVTHDSDNAFLLGKPIDEVDGRQWQFIVPTAHPVNVGERYANLVRVPLQPLVTPRLALP